MLKTRMQSRNLWTGILLASVASGMSLQHSQAISTGLHAAARCSLLLPTVNRSYCYHLRSRSRRTGATAAASSQGSGQQQAVSATVSTDG